MKVPKLISEGREHWFQPLEVLAKSERRTTSSVLGLADQISPNTLAMVFVRTYHTRCEQDEAIRRRDEVPKSKKARSICAGLLFEGRLTLYPERWKV